MRPSLIILLLLLAFTLRSQDFSRSNKKYRGKFNYELVGKEEVLRNWYHYVVSRKADGSHILRVFHPEAGQITSRVQYKDAELTVRHGEALAWYDDGNPRSAGRYVEGNAESAWVYHQFGGGREEGNMLNGQRDGTWSKWNKKGQLMADHSYRAGVLHGTFTVYDPEGNIFRTGNYHEGRIEDGVKPAFSEEDVLDVYPHWVVCSELGSNEERGKCTETRIMEHLRQHLRYPALARDMGISGQAVFHFVVDANGRITGLRKANGLCRAIEDECRRVILLMPEWRPGIRDGDPVDTHYRQPVKFTLR